MKMKYILFFVLFFVPVFVKADVIISEVAWMGTVESQFEEWIEIRNTGSESVSLTGWKIYKAGGETVLFSLSGEISASSYFLVCRTTASVTNPLSGICDMSGSFGGSGLNNTSEHIILKNSSGTNVDEIIATSGWPAGDSSTKQTMQKNGSSWITAEGTPGESNATTGTGNEDGDDPPAEEEEEDDDESESSTSSSSSSKEPTKPTYTKKIVDIKVVDNSVPVGTPVKFSLDTRDLKGAEIYKGEFFWNMGDATERHYFKNEKFEHTYDHEGTYIVYLKYYPTYFEGMEPEVVDKITITVGNPSVLISKIHPDGSVEIKNSSSQEIDLSGWSLKDNFGKTFIIPDGTYIQGSKTLVLNSKRLKLSSANIILFSPSGSLASYSDSLASNTSTKSSASRSSSQSSSSKISSVAKGEVMGDSDTGDTVNLNDRLTANASSSIKQKQPSIWMIVFVGILVSTCVLVLFLYKKKEEKVVTEEDEFQLID